MPPIAVDTNILARAPLADDAEQQTLARQLLTAASNGPGVIVSSFAILELAWVLKVRKVPRADIARTIRALMEAEGMMFTHWGILHEALLRFEAGTADLGECLIAADAAAAGAGAFATFDLVPREEGWGIAPEALLSSL